MRRVLRFPALGNAADEQEHDEQYQRDTSDNARRDYEPCLPIVEPRPKAAGIDVYRYLVGNERNGLTVAVGKRERERNDLLTVQIFGLRRKLEYGVVELAHQLGLVVGNRVGELISVAYELCEQRVVIGIENIVADSVLALDVGYLDGIETESRYGHGDYDGALGKRAVRRKVLDGEIDIVAAVLLERELEHRRIGRRGVRLAVLFYAVKRVVIRRNVGIDIL